MEKYTHNIDETIRSNMQEFTGGECYLIDRRVNSGVTGTGKENNCHLNVQDLVDRIGGERISGWLLAKDKNYEDGIYSWIWHSLWKTPEDKIVDVTQSSLYKDQKTGIFWLDKKRTSNLEEGIYYNSIACISNTRARKILKEYTKKATRKEKTLVVGKVYWTWYLEFFREVETFNGQMRSLEGYEGNQRLMEEKYGIKITGNSFNGEHLSDKDKMELLFDFLVSRRGL